MDEPDEDLQAFIKSLDEAEDEAELNGCVPSDVLRRRLDEAKARGLRERARDMQIEEVSCKVDAISFRSPSRHRSDRWT